MYVEIDGSQGEGGGQMLRTALTLSLITGTAFTLKNVRANRKPGGLRPQHLACVRGAELLGQGEATGAQVGSSELSFQPGKVSPGDYLLDVGTAGSTPLLLQCLAFPLALAGGGVLTLQGGTHLPHSPSYHYLAWIWGPAVAVFGLPIELSMKRAGFYPEGGGEVRARIPAAGEAPDLVELPARGMLRDVEVTSFVGGLPFELAERQASAATSALLHHGIASQAENFPLPVTRSKGTAVFIRTHFENSVAGFMALGEKGVRAEQVGEEAAQQVADFLGSAGSVDEHLADQLLLPAALMAAGRLGPSSPGRTSFTTSRVTDHLTTNARVIERFLPVRTVISPEGAVRVEPA